MGLESTTVPSGLVVTNPAEGDDVDEGNNHFWLVKTALKYLGKKAINEAVTVTGTTGTAVAGQLHICTNAGAVTMTLPASPEAMDACGFVFTNNGTSNVLARNSQPIQSAASDKTLSAYVSNSITVWRYVDATRGWLPEQY